jgi:hypothetical protein
MALPTHPWPHTPCLAQVRGGAAVLDPCCGSGGLLLCAAALGRETAHSSGGGGGDGGSSGGGSDGGDGGGGVRTFGVDVDAAALAGVPANFEQHGLPPPLLARRDVALTCLRSTVPALDLPLLHLDPPPPYPHLRPHLRPHLSLNPRYRRAATCCVPRTAHCCTPLPRTMLSCATFPTEWVHRSTRERRAQRRAW